MAKCHDRCLSESNRHRRAPASIWCDRVGFLPRLQLGFLTCMNDILNGAGAEDFLRWAVPGSTLSWMPWRRVPGCRTICLRGRAPNCAAGREHAVRSSGQVNRDPAGFQPAQHGERTAGPIRFPLRNSMTICAISSLSQSIRYRFSTSAAAVAACCGS
jgi:hypothetical protein